MRFSLRSVGYGGKLMASNRAFIAGILVVLGLGVFASIAAANNFGKGAPSLDPEAGLSNSQREDIHRSLESAFQQKYGDWLNSSAAIQQDLRRLEHRELNASYLPAQPTLIDAASHADSIIAGMVTKIAFEPSGAVVTLNVTKTRKGPLASEVLVIQGGGLFPAPDFKAAYLVDDLSAPLLLPGDRVVLLLEKTERSDGALAIQGFSGFYPSNGGRVRSIPGNPFSGQVDGKTEDELMSAMPS